MRYLWRIFAWIGVGFGYQILAYGPDTWTSMAMVAHVLGWPLFMITAALHFGVWVLLGFALLLGGIYLLDRFVDWRRALRRRNMDKARRAAR